MRRIWWRACACWPRRPSGWGKGVSGTILIFEAEPKSSKQKRIGVKFFPSKSMVLDHQRGSESVKRLFDNIVNSTQEAKRNITKRIKDSMIGTALAI